MVGDEADENRELWLTVIHQAVVDARMTLPSPTAGVYPDRLLCRDEAHAWFTRAGADFQAVCRMAGVNADVVRRKYLAGKLNPIPEGRTRSQKPNRRRKKNIFSSI